MAKISILVAVYNAEKYLRTCLDSLEQQTFQDIQVLCVDDASTDASLRILREYAVKDARIEVVSLQENVGQAKARNVALQKATGLYTCFLDSDDWLSPDALQKVVEKFAEDEEIDSVLFRCRYVRGQQMSDYPMDDFGCISGQEAFADSLTWKIHGIYAVKTAIHKQYPYDDSSRSYSDDNTTRLHYLFSRKVALCDGVYYYRQHESSVTHQVSLRRFDYLKANAHMKKILEELKVEEAYLNLYENHRWLNLIGMVLFGFHHRSAFTPEEWMEAMKVMHDAWSSIEARRLNAKNHYKLGYLLCRPSWMPERMGWALFLMQEKMYYRLRKLLNRPVC